MLPKTAHEPIGRFTKLSDTLNIFDPILANSKWSDPPSTPQLGNWSSTELWPNGFNFKNLILMNGLHFSQVHFYHKYTSSDSVGVKPMASVTDKQANHWIFVRLFNRATIR